jgi:hypothetical protein
MLRAVVVAVYVALMATAPFISLASVLQYRHLVVDGVWAPGVITSVSLTRGAKTDKYTATYDFEDMKGKRRSGNQKIGRKEYELYRSRPNYPVEVRYVPSAPRNNAVSLSSRQGEAGMAVMLGWAGAFIVTLAFLYDQSTSLARQRADHHRRIAAMCRREGWRAQTKSNGAADWLAHYQRLEKEHRESEKQHRARLETLLARRRPKSPVPRSVVQAA